MTAAHLPGAILTPRCRGARAVATFSGGVESRNAPARIAPATPCSSLGVERPDAQPEPPRAQSRSSDEITVCRECIQTTRDLKLRKQMQGKLAELLAEEGRRQTHEDLPL